MHDGSTQVLSAADAFKLKVKHFHSSNIPDLEDRLKHRNATGGQCRRLHILYRFDFAMSESRVTSQDGG